MLGDSITSTQPVASEAKRFFDENGYYLARNVSSAPEVAALEGFNENVNARRESAAMNRIGTKNTVVVHTHNV